ncbi:hypothetical protein PR048_023646 [Dryococelus australis]|uniref:THAP-type domain-containing protein n=1 Tax=Dryococelus australis TaxID=614101 RepID=A0ABQ9GUN7_9NEOP|nr:hypothetical protein PR048_023646 [Dryococelus australis]
MMPRRDKCCVPHCKYTPGTVRHSFPVYDEEEFNIWLQRIANPKFDGLDDIAIYKDILVCDEHFNVHCKSAGTKKLEKFSLPTLNLPGAVLRGGIATGSQHATTLRSQETRAYLSVYDQVLETALLPVICEARCEFRHRRGRDPGKAAQFYRTTQNNDFHIFTLKTQEEETQIAVAALQSHTQGTEQRQEKCFSKIDELQSRFSQLDIDLSTRLSISHETVESGIADLRENVEKAREQTESNITTIGTSEESESAGACIQPSLSTDETDHSSVPAHEECAMPRHAFEKITSFQKYRMHETHTKEDGRQQKRFRENHGMKDNGRQEETRTEWTVRGNKEEGNLGNAENQHPYKLIIRRPNVVRWCDAYKSSRLADVVWKGERRITRLSQPNPIWRVSTLLQFHELSCRGINIALVAARSLGTTCDLRTSESEVHLRVLLRPWQIGYGDYPQLVASPGGSGVSVNNQILAPEPTGKRESAVIVDVGNPCSLVRDGEAHLLEVVQQSSLGGGSRGAEK